MKPTRSQRLGGQRRIGEVAGSTPPTTSAASAPSRAAAQDRVESHVPAAVGTLRCPGPLDLEPCGCVDDRPTARQQRGQRPASTAPRSPARRGTQASVAPVRSASAAAARQRSGRRRQPLADQDDRAVAAELIARNGLSGASSAAASPPGTNLNAACRRACAARARRTARATDIRASRPRRLAQPQEDDRRLLLGLEAREQHGRRRLERRRSETCSRRGPATLRGEEGQLLGRRRTGAEVDVVRAERDPGELGVRVGVLLGEPSAGQHADAAAVESLAPARSRPARAPRASSLDKLAGSSSRTSGVEQPVGLRRVVERPAALVAVPLLVDLGSSPAKRRVTLLRRQSVRCAQPDEQCSQTESVLTSGRTGGPGSGRTRRSARRPGRSARCCRRSRTGTAPRRCADLLLRAALEQVDERVAGDLRRRSGCSAGTARTARGRAARCDEIAIGLGNVRLSRGSGSRPGRCSSPGSAAGTRRPCRRSGSPAGG